MPEKQTILVVDDREVDRRLIRKILESSGYNVEEAANGEEGLGNVGCNKPDLIIADTLMPEMDGFHFLRNIKKDESTKTIPFILYSAVYTGRRDEKLALSLGANAFIQKPTDTGEFLLKVEAAIKDAKNGKGTATAELALEDEEYLMRYGQVVATKLEDKVRELAVANECLQLQIEERKAAEEELRETLSYLENLFNCANAPIIVWDPEFRITLFNDAFEHLIGTGAVELLDAPLGSIFPEDVRDWAVADICRMTEGASIELPLLRADKTVRTVLWSSATIYAADETTAVATIAHGQDVTECRRVEKEAQKSSSIRE